MGEIVVNYPHWRPSFEPKRLCREDIWQLAESVRRQICGPIDRPKIAAARMLERTRRLKVNGVSFDVHWEFKGGLTDEFGNPVLGFTTHDERWSNAAMIYLNSDEIREREDLARSTAAHELGHSIFEVPAWIARRRRPRAAEAVPERRFQVAVEAGAGGTEKVDWGEWGCNEFMGGCLTPLRLFHLHVHKRAAALGVPMTESDKSLPIINGRKACSDSIEELAIEVAAIFGVSISFVHMRMRRYRLISVA
jgi:hypothetical protein